MFLFQPLREANFANYMMVQETKKTQEVFPAYSFHRISISVLLTFILLTPSGVTTGWILFLILELFYTTEQTHAA